MRTFEENAPSKLTKGCRFYLLAALVLILGTLAIPVQATDHVWGCLLYGSNSVKASFDLPPRLSGYDLRLRNGLGFSNYRVIAQREADLENPSEYRLVSAGDIQVRLTSLSRASDGKYLVGIVFLEGTSQVMETQARVGEGSPLFIRGPAWREGQIIIVVMVCP
jgi:hypothetical protein